MRIIPKNYYSHQSDIMKTTKFFKEIYQVRDLKRYIFHSCSFRVFEYVDNSKAFYSCMAIHTLLTD